jgi:AraC-like DNA-binding protein
LERAAAMMPHSIPFSVVSRICAGAVAEGVSQEMLLARSLIEPRHDDDRDRISPAQLLLLCMNANYSAEDGAHGLGMQRLPIAYSSIGLRTMLGCATLEGGLRGLERLYEIAGSTVRIKLQTDGDDALLVVHAEGRDEAASYTVEDTYLSWMSMHCGQFLGRRFPVAEILTRDPAHASLGGSHFALGARVRRGRFSALRFPKTLLAFKRAGRGSDTPIWDCMRPWLQSADESQQLADGVAVWSLGIDGLAKRAGVSGATMRRRLEESGGGYRQARQRDLARAGIARLRASDASVESVAADLGYADARSFRRFLKSATGKTPNDIRNDRMSADSGDDDRLLERVREMALLLDRQ